MIEKFNLLSKFRSLIEHPMAIFGVDSAVPRAAVQGRPLSIVLCNDADQLHSNLNTISGKLKKSGYDLEVAHISDERELLDYLDTVRRLGAASPDAFFLDVCGVGVNAARKVVSWYDSNRPGDPLPALNFLSLSIDMGIDAASRLRDSDPRIDAGFVDERELRWLGEHLKGRDAVMKPHSIAFRALLNDHLGTAIPLTYEENSYYAAAVKKLSRTTTKDCTIEAWRKGRISGGEVVESMRDYAMRVATALQKGYYGERSGDLRQDENFYSGTGTPMSGPVVLSLEEARKAQGSKPVLVMQAYDPAVVPLLASGTLGGLVVTSPFMASHLKLLCETHMVTGLFGVMPAGSRGLSREFNEETQPDLPPYFSGGEARIGTQTVTAGQTILIGYQGNGLVAQPPADLKSRPAAPDAQNPAESEKLRDDLNNLRSINACLISELEKAGVTPHGVKANIESARPATLEKVRDIGLVRTEQMVAANPFQADMVKTIWFSDHENEKEDAYENLFLSGIESYAPLIAKLDEDKAVKIRLYDFVHREILDKEEQNRFLQRYGKLDIHGGEALAAWPKLYAEQLHTIFRIYNDFLPTEHRLEIMMPAVETEQDVLKIRKMAKKEARKLDLPEYSYDFGVMIETLKSCENIAAIAPHCSFISFGTNDLTQEYFGMARSDLKAHAEFAAKRGFDPFRTLAPEILDLMKSVVEKGRAANPDLRIDVCGAQAADVETADRLFAIGVDNVSVAPSVGNLNALPLLLNYRAYDRIKPSSALAPVVLVAPERASLTA